MSGCQSSRSNLHKVAHVRVGVHPTHSGTCRTLSVVRQEPSSFVLDIASFRDCPPRRRSPFNANPSGKVSRNQGIKHVGVWRVQRSAVGGEYGVVEAAVDKVQAMWAVVVATRRKACHRDWAFRGTGERKRLPRSRRAATPARTSLRRPRVRWAQQRPPGLFGGTRLARGRTVGR